MNSIDYILLVPLVLAGIRGFSKGFIVEIFSLIAFIAAIILALKFSHVIISLLQPYVGTTPIPPFVAYLIVFIGTIFLVNFSGKLIQTFVNLIQLGLINRLAGLIFGIIKTALIISLLLWLLNKVHILTEESKTQSLFYYRLEPLAPYIIEKVTNNLPFFKDIINQIDEFFKGIDTTSEEPPVTVLLHDFTYR